MEKTIMNELRDAKYYQLLFKNNLELSEDMGELGFFGDQKDIENFESEYYGEASEDYPVGGMIEPYDLWGDR